MSESESESDNNYFSNTDSEKEVEETLDQLYPEDEEEDYEINEIISNHIQSIDINDEVNSYEAVKVEKKEKKKKKEKVSTKKTIEFTMNEFTVEKEDSKKGKWKSKRMQDIKRRKGHNTDRVSVTRRFHPNLPSPLYLKLNNFNNSKSIKINDTSFPTLE